MQLVLPAPPGASSVAVSSVGAVTKDDLWILAVSSSRNDVEDAEFMKNVCAVLTFFHDEKRLINLEVV